MLILLYIEYIFLYLGKILEVHSGNPLNYVTNSNIYIILKTNNIWFSYHCSLFFFFLNLSVLSTLNIVQPFTISNKIY